jgi:O-antigen/teichoic acid export membrane protein
LPYQSFLQASGILVYSIFKRNLLYFQKELKFNKLFFYEFFSTLIDLSLAISLALILRNVWALVWAGLAGQFARLILSYVVHSYRPRLRFDKGEFTELFGFGKWVFASSIIVFIVTQGDDIIVGKMLGVVALAFYQMAYTFSNMAVTEIIQVVSRVMLPAYSKLQDDLPKLKQAYLKVLQITAFVSAPFT